MVPIVEEKRNNRLRRLGHILKREEIEKVRKETEIEERMERGRPKKMV